MTYRVLPNGAEARSEVEYIQIWSAMARQLENVLNCRVLGFDPNFVVIRDGHSRSCELPFWLAEKIIDLHDELKSLVEDSRNI